MPSQNIAVRVDASGQIGTGHFMRCLTLADGLKQSGVHIRFVSRYLPEHLRDMLTAKGHEFVLLEGLSNSAEPDELAHASWLGVSQIQDAEDAIRALSDEEWDWLVVDHYALDARWEFRLRQRVGRILAIDDIADRKHDCDLLLDQNFYIDMESRYEGKVPSHCEMLLGPRYALLRDEFSQLHMQVKPRTGQVKRVLVFFGGMDANNYTGRAIEALAGSNIAGLQVDVVIGLQHPAREQIEAACKQYRYTCYIQTDRMAELMALSDLAIGAGGTAIWERCCLGLPALAFCTVENQSAQITDAAVGRLLYTVEDAGDLKRSIQDHIGALVFDDHLRQLISERCLQTVDGRGAMRVISRIIHVDIREACAEDSENIFRWRNHPSIRSVSRNSDLVDWQDHQKWFASVLSDTNRKLLIGTRGGEPVGVVRFDLNQDEAEVSIYLVPDGSASGLGRTLLQSSEQWLVSKRPEIREIHAYVLGENDRSRKLFTESGYQRDSSSLLKRLH